MTDIPVAKYFGKRLGTQPKDEAERILSTRRYCGSKKR
jgi:hypothetical protein